MAKKKKKKKTFWRKLWRLTKGSYGVLASTKSFDVNLGTPRVFGYNLTFTAFVIFLLIAILGLTILLSNNSVDVETADIVITGLSDDFEGYKILLISDLNGKSFGQDHSTLMRKLDNYSFNCVVFAGDMIGKRGNTEMFYSLITQLATYKKPMYFIAGDMDPDPILDTPRDSASGGYTLKQLVLNDWVLEAEELGATFVDTPIQLTKGSSSLWLFPDTYLNMDVNAMLELYKDEVTQQTDSYLEGVEVAKDNLPLTTYRRNLLYKASALISSVGANDLLVMISHEAPTDAQLLKAQAALSAEDAKNMFLAPDLVLAGHYCGGEWRLPFIGALHVNSNILDRYGWFPEDKYVKGSRTVGNIVVYTTPGLSTNGATWMYGRINNPPRVSLLTLTGELPASFLE